MVSAGGWEEPATHLMNAFQRYHSQKSQAFIRLTSFLVLIVSTILIALDASRFSGDTLRVMLALRLAVVDPLCVAVIIWTFHRSYLNHTQWLAIPLALLGIFIIAYAIVGNDPSYGSLAVFIVYIYGCVQSQGFARRCSPHLNPDPHAYAALSYFYPFSDMVRCARRALTVGVLP